MRVRTFDEPSPWQNLVVGLLDPEALSGYTTSLYSSDSFSVWNSHPGPYRKRSGRIEDVLSPEHVFPRPMNPVSHLRYEPAWMEIRRNCVFTTPAPPCSIRVDMPFMYKPTITVAPGPWATMVDELASLASGNVSNAAALPVTLLEGAKTIAMLRNPFNLLKPNFRRKVRKLTAATLANRGAGIWLEGYYGWKSLYQDMETIAKATATFLNDDHQRYLEKLGERLAVRQSTVNLTELRYAIGTSVSTWKYYSYGGTWKDPSTRYYTQGHFARLANIEEKTSYVLSCRQFQEVSERINRTKRFLNLAGVSSWRSIRDTIWEVIPFSFVIDWFVDSRGIWAPLNKLRLRELDIKNLCYSSSLTGTYDVDFYLSGNPFYYCNATPWYTQRCTNMTGACVSRSITRGKYSLYNRSVGLPPCDEVSLFGGKGLSFIRTINGAALITQLFSRRK